MTDFVILAILVIALAVGISSTIKHFKGHGGCCGGGGYKPRRKRLPRVIYRKRFSVSGMHCKQCKIRAEEAINDIRGVAARVNLAKGELTVLYAEDVDDELIRRRLERLGYTATKIDESV